ncbi:unnamed protein product [Polarella glacialis]|uniref:Uncharacterized protein n=1 Tax=Polarella glacialis TaxID=89957 RepID=A0A813E4E3_POLGL|nr:unnamed protein product [Polarella glacialis]
MEALLAGQAAAARRDTSRATTSRPEKGRPPQEEKQLRQEPSARQGPSRWFPSSRKQGGGYSLQDVLLAKIVQDMNAPRSKKDRKDKGFDGSESGSDSDLDGVLLRKGLASKKNISRLKRRIHKQPKRVWYKFESMVKDEMGVSVGEAWSFRNWARRVQ